MVAILDFWSTQKKTYILLKNIFVSIQPSVIPNGSVGSYLS
jgi:hypothetical protein